jgi:hypothetical protein
MLLTTARSAGWSTSSHVPLPIRESYSCYIEVFHSGACALERAARYDVGSTQSLVDMRAMSSADAPAGKCEGEYYTTAPLWAARQCPMSLCRTYGHSTR